MADAGKNPVWNNIGNKASNVQNDILGPSYSYSDNIPGPTSLGVGNNGSFGQLFTNTNAAVQYIKTMITGDPPLGNQYFVNTGGTCTAPDGSVQPRYNYINNIPSGADLVPSSMNELSFVTSDLNGLIPGIVGDIEGLDPLYLFNSLTADGNPSCDCYKCAVTDGSAYNFLTPELSPDFDTNLCTKVDPSNCKQTAPPETFQNQYTCSSIPTIVAGIALVLLTFSGR